MEHLQGVSTDWYDDRPGERNALRICNYSMPMSVYRDCYRLEGQCWVAAIHVSNAHLGVCERGPCESAIRGKPNAPCDDRRRQFAGYGVSKRSSRECHLEYQRHIPEWHFAAGLQCNNLGYYVHGWLLRAERSSD